MGYDGDDDTVLRFPLARRPGPASAPAPASASSGAVSSGAVSSGAVSSGAVSSGAVSSGPGDDEVLDGDTIIPVRTARRLAPDPLAAGLPPDGAPPTPTTRYRLRVNGDQPIELDRTTIVGRRPGTARIPGGSEPRLIAVESPEHEVSSNHARIVQEGGSVVVTDLRSTNGTIVTLPSSEQVRLRPGESFVAVPGSLIDIGDGNVMEILAAERLFPTDGWMR